MWLMIGTKLPLGQLCHLLPHCLLGFPAHLAMGTVDLFSCGTLTVETREWKRVAIEAVMPSEPKKFQRRKVGKIFSISLSQGSVCYSMIDK